MPFMLKLAGQKTEQTYDTPINTLLTRELLLLILQGKLKREREVAEWLILTLPKVHLQLRHNNERLEITGAFRVTTVAI